MNRQFTRHLGAMAVGSGLAYAIPLMALPVLSRLYAPEQFGVVATVVAVATLSALLLTWRYELAIVLPREDHEAEVIAAATAAMSVLMLAPLVVVLYAVSALLRASGSDIERIMEVAWWIPPYAILIGWTQIGTSLANRHRMYPRIASATAGQQLGIAAVAALLGVIARNGPGLIVARVAGQGLAVALYVAAHTRWLRRLPALLADPRRLPLLREHYRFPVFNVAYSLLGTFSREALVLLFTGFGNLVAAGHYGMARMVLLAPASLLSASLSQLFYREAVSGAGSASFPGFTFALQRVSAILGALPLGFVALWGPEIFGLAFGDRWSDAGRYAALLSPVALLAILTGWPERIFEVRRRQSLALAIQFVFDAAAIGSMAWLLAHGEDAYTALQAFAGIQAAYHLCYLAAVFRLVPIPFTRLVALLAAATSLFVAPTALNLLLGLAGLGDQARLAVGALIGCVVYAVLVAVESRGALRLLGARP